MDYNLEKLKREYIDVVRNNFIIMKTSDPLNKEAVDRLIDIFRKMNINSFQTVDKVPHYYAGFFCIKC